MPKNPKLDKIKKNIFQSLRKVLMPKKKSTIDIIVDSIAEKRVLRIYYRGEDTKDVGFRFIEPVAVGRHFQSGNMVLRAYQIRGATDTPQNHPGWRMFRLDGIKKIAATKQTYNTIRPNYNTAGDSHMVDIKIHATFNYYGN